MANRIQLRRDTAANWTSTNPTLAQGELGIESDTLKAKVGDGVTAWNSISSYLIIPASAYQLLTGKDATGGYAGLTLFKINFNNALNTFTSFFTNSNTAARTYTFQDRDGTIADTSDFVGAQDLWIGAAAMWTKTTSGCAAVAKTEMTTSLVNIQTLDFDSSSQEFAQFTIALPRNWNNGTVTAKFYWTAASGSGGVVWGLSGGAYSDDDALTVALGTAQTSTDTLLAANDLHISPATSAITLAGTPADSDFLAFQISRNPSDGSDTLAVDAKLLGIMLTITTDAGIAS